MSCSGAHRRTRPGCTGAASARPQSPREHTDHLRFPCGRRAAACRARFDRRHPCRQAAARRAHAQAARQRRGGRRAPARQRRRAADAAVRRAAPPGRGGACDAAAAVELARRHPRCGAGPAAAAGARRRHRPAQPRRLPACGRWCRRARGDRPEGSRGGVECHRGQGGQRRGRHRAVSDGHQPGAHLGRTEGTRHPRRRHSATRPRPRCTAPICAARWRWCSAPKAPACAS